MTFASASQFHVYTYCGVKARLAYCLNSVLNVKALIGAFNQEKALVGAFSVIVQFHRLIVNSFNYYDWSACGGTRGHDDEQRGPEVEEGEDRAPGVPDVGVVAARHGDHGAQLRVAQRAHKAGQLALFTLPGK